MDGAKMGSLDAEPLGRQVSDFDTKHERSGVNGLHLLSGDHRTGARCKGQFRYSGATLSLLVAMLFVLSMQPALARPVMATSHPLGEQLAALRTGDQLVIERQNGTLSFAGRSIALEGFSGVAGYGSDVAYLVVIDGVASIGAVEAGRGRMLLIPAFNKAPRVERFDARRLHDALVQQGAKGGSGAIASLGALADKQDIGVWFGRLGRTRFNVTTMGSAKAERARRLEVGGTAVRALRFAGDDQKGQREAQIVSAFLSALAAGDATTAAQFLDPLPFGQASLGAGSDAGRLAMASALAGERDWSRFASETPRETADTVWTVGPESNPVAIRLRRTHDFAFIESIQVRD